MLVVKNLLATAGNIRDAGSIPGSGRSPGGGHGNHSSILTWRVLWTKFGRLESIGSQRVRHDWGDLAFKFVLPPTFITYILFFNALTNIRWVHIACWAFSYMLGIQQWTNTNPGLVSLCLNQPLIISCNVKLLLCPSSKTRNLTPFK